MAQPPFRLATPSVPTPRNVLGRFVRNQAGPASPLQEVKPATNDQQIMSGWAPGIAQGTADLQGQRNPYPDAPPARLPFKLS